MKNIRNIAIVVAALSAVAANAQSFELEAGAGVQNVSGNVWQIGQIGAQFTFDVYFQNGGQALSLNALYVALAHGTAAGSGTTATDASGKLDPVSATGGVAGSGLTFGAPVLRGGATGSAGNNNPSGVARPYVAYLSALDNPSAPNPAQIAANARVRVATITLVNTGIAANDIFGDSDSETGIYVYNQGGSGLPSLGGSGYGIAGGTTGARAGSSRIALQAVPEPGTMAAVAAGLAALAARRRKK